MNPEVWADIINKLTDTSKPEELGTVEISAGADDSQRFCRLPVNHYG